MCDRDVIAASDITRSRQTFTLKGIFKSTVSFSSNDSCCLEEMFRSEEIVDMKRVYILYKRGGDWSMMPTFGQQQELSESGKGQVLGQLEEILTSVNPFPINP